MIFIHRLGIVLYWVGYALALLFAILSLLVALNGLTSGGPISGACVFAVVSTIRRALPSNIRCRNNGVPAQPAFARQPAPREQLARPALCSTRRCLTLQH